MNKYILTTLTLFAIFALPSQAALLMQDDFNDPGGDWQNWTAAFDQNAHFAEGRISVTGGQLVFSGDGVAQICDAFRQNIEAVADVTLGATAAGGFFTLGFVASTAHGSVVDCDLYEDSGTFYVGVYSGGSYVASAALSPQPAPGSSYTMTATRNGDNFAILLQDGAITVAQTNATVAGIFDKGIFYVKSTGLNVSVDSLTIVDTDSSTVDFQDDFTSLDATKWGFDPNPDVNEGGGGGMRIYNFRSDGVTTDLPVFNSDGFLTLAPTYNRVPSRYWPAQGYNHYGNVDVMVKLQLNEASYFSVALDNRTNEGARTGVVLDTVNNQLIVANNLQLQGFGGGTPGFTAVSGGGPLSLSGVYNRATNPDVYLYIQRNGNTVNAWLGLAAGGAEIAGSKITGANISGANASGQIVLCNHNGGTPKVDQIAVWDYNSGWTLSVDHWSEY